MTHEEAICAAMKAAGSNKSKLARDLGLKGGIASINPKLKRDIQLSGLIAMANALGYEVVLQPKPESDDWRPKGQLVLDDKPAPKADGAKGGDAE